MTANQSEAPGPGGDLRILLIEDDDSVRDAIVASLEELGIGDVSIAVDGQSGLDMIESLHPEVVLLDLMLPVTDGFDVLAQLRKRPADYHPDRIVVISAMSDTLSNEALLQLGASYVLRKPFTLAEIETAIRG